MKHKVRFILAIAGMILGVLIAILFGTNEALFKNKIAQDLLQNEKIIQIQDVEAKKLTIAKEKSKNWRYYQRFHFHASAISTMSLALLIFLSFAVAPAMITLICSYMISIGGFLYPFVWLFAGIYGPIMGRHEAKESFAFFGYMGGVMFLGIILALFITIKYPNKLLSKS